MENVDDFNYVSVTTKGYEGCINLFFGNHVLALITNVALADKIKNCVKERHPAMDWS